MLLSSSFLKPQAHGSLQEKMGFYLPYLPVLREDFVVLRWCLKTPAEGFPKGGRPDSRGRRLLSLLLLISSCLANSSGADHSALGCAAREGGEETPPKYRWGRPEAEVGIWTETPQLGIKGKDRIVFLPRGKSRQAFGSAAGARARDGAGTHGQGAGVRAGVPAGRQAWGPAGRPSRAAGWPLHTTVDGSAARIL